MTQLPSLVQRAPSFLYGLAILLFLWSFALSYNEISLTSAGTESGDPVVRHAMLRGLYQATLDAVYVAANGVIAHILLAIWRSGAPPKGGGSE